MFFSDFYYDSIVNVVYPNLLMVILNTVVIVVLDVIFWWLMLKLPSDCSLSEFNRSAQKQCTESNLIVDYMLFTY